MTKQERPRKPLDQQGGVTEKPGQQQKSQDPNDPRQPRKPHFDEAPIAVRAPMPAAAVRRADYSCRKASIGSRRAARRAGK